MATAIKIENLGKKYTIKNSKQTGSQYTSLRDVLSDSIKSVGKKILHPRQMALNAPSSNQDFWALKNINLTVEQGDKLAIIGHNGAGKSTLLKILSQITEPTTGNISINGRIASLLEVGTGFHPELTGRENIFLNGSILGMSKKEIKHKFDEIVDFAGVETFLDTPVKRYSSGMRMRLGFAVAAHLESEILVIDEVLAVGDAAFQKKCLGKINDVSREEGRTILFVSHNMGAVQQLCDKGALLEHGELLALGSVSEITNKYMMQGIDAATYKVRDGIDYIKITNPKDFIQSFPYKNPELGILFNNTTSEILQEVYLNIAIINERGQRVMQLSSAETTGGFTIKPGEFEISLSLKSPVPLSPGFYTIDAHFYSQSRGNIMLAYSIFQFELNRGSFEDHQFNHLNMTAEPVLLPKFTIKMDAENNND